jgi:hypothetical protein
MDGQHFSYITNLKKNKKQKNKRPWSKVKGHSKMMTIIVEHKSNLVLDVDNTIQVSTNNHTK